MQTRVSLTALVVVLSLVVLPALRPAEASAQAFFVDASLNQSFADDPLPSPVGFSVTMGRTSMIGRLGIHAGLRQLYEDGDELAQHCNFATCTPGPFDQSHSMQLVFVGLSYDFPNPTDVYLNLAVNLGRTQQTEHLENMTSGEEFDSGGGEETTLGGAIDLRLRPFIGPLRPAFSARYDRIFQSDCLADGVCFPERDVWTLSVGLSWVAPAR